MESPVSVGERLVSHGFQMRGHLQFELAKEGERAMQFERKLLDDCSEYQGTGVKQSVIDGELNVTLR